MLIYTLYILYMIYFFSNLGGEKMLCKGCLAQLSRSISKEGVKVLQMIAKSQKGLTQADILEDKNSQRYNLSYSKVNRVIVELEAKLLIDYQVEGRSKRYNLTQNAVNLFKFSAKNK